MTGEEEIRLMGQPIKIIMPGVHGEIISNKYGSTKNIITLKAAQTYSGYAWCDLDDEFSYSWRDIYVEIDGILHCLDEYLGSFCKKYPITDFVFKTQCTVTFEKIHKMIIFLYNKMECRFNSIEDSLNDKIDRD